MGRRAPAGRWSRGVLWSAALWMAFVHAGVLFAPFYFTWKGLALALVLIWMTGSLGICMGFHRLLTHGGFETYPVVRRFLAWLGTIAGEGPPIMWVAAHRKHHLYSDKDEDPHTPHHGAWWSHMLWMLPRHGPKHWAEMYRRYAPDLLKDPYLRFLNKTFLWWQPILAGTMYFAGWSFWDVRTGISFVVYGMFVRLMYVMHVTWMINSATHMWGYRNYETGDNSRNLWWVALLSFGEGWHNNHHAFQRMARHGHRWWEFDSTWLAIRAMQRVGLAWNVIADPPRQRETADCRAA